MQEHFFEERGIAYRLSALRDGLPTLVFIHGLSGSCSVWYPFEKKFEDRFNILTMDLRGHGRSKRWPRYDDYELPSVAEDLALLLDKLGIRRYTLIGHSFGAQVALELLLRRSGAEKVVLLGSVYGFQRIARTKLTRGLLSLVVRLFPRTGNLRPGGRTDYGRFPDTADWDIRRIVADVGNTGLRTYLYCVDHVYKYSRDNEWLRVNIPALIVHGRHDTYVPVAHAVELSQLMPHAKLQILENANHILVVNNLEEVASAIESFAAAAQGQ